MDRQDPVFEGEEKREIESLTTVKRIEGTFRKAELLLPAAVRECPGIALFGRVIRSLVFSTDIAIIRNCDADAVLAVYPFTCQPSITQALLSYAERPVFTGVSGAVTTGVRSVELAIQSEMQGASAVVANTSTPPEVIASMARSIDIPVVVSIFELNEFSIEQINAGAQIVNVTAGRDTMGVVEELRTLYPTLPIIASGGKTNESVRATIAAGADAVSWTPPSLAELERHSMEKNAALHKLNRNEPPEDETPEQRESRLLKYISNAAGQFYEIDEERRRQLVSEPAQSVNEFLSRHLDVTEQTLLRSLIAKLFEISQPGTDEAAAQQAEQPEAQGESQNQVSTENEN